MPSNEFIHYFKSSKRTLELLERKITEAYRAEPV